MNHVKKFVALAVLVVVAFAFAACGSRDYSDQIVVITPAAQHGWMAGVIFFAEQAAEELGLGNNFRLLTSDNVADQSTQIDDMIALGVGAIVLQPHNFEMELPAERILEAGIPLVLFNRYLEVSYDAYVAGSNFQMGFESGMKIGNGLGGIGHVVTVSNPSAGSTSVVRNEGFEYAMRNFPNITTFEMTVEGFSQEAALSSMADVLVANPNIDAVFSIDDETSLGVLQAIREAGRTDIQFISGGGGAQNYFQEIHTEANINLFSATYSPRMMGDAIRVAYDLLNGRNVPELGPSVTNDRGYPQWIIPPSIITRDNVENYFAPDSPY